MQGHQIEADELAVAPLLCTFQDPISGTTTEVKYFCRWSVKDMKGLTSGQLLDEHGLPDIVVDDGPLVVERVWSFLCWIRVVLLAGFHLELRFADSSAEFELVQNSAIGSRKVSFSFW